MKTTGWRSLVLYILGLGFLAGLIFFLVCFFTQGGSWAMRASNAHLSGINQLANSGTITDRNGIVLAKSENGNRIYPPDVLTRKAMLHVVGDTRGYISTSVQATYRSQLTGYNPVTGINSLKNNDGGGDIELTISSSLSKLALQQLNGKNGAVAIYNYKTGEVLCMVSSPNFDPANPPSDLDTDQSGKYEGVYLNKALSSTYTPGSIFKLVTTAAAIENIPNIEQRTFQCTGKTVINGREITCDSVHGTINYRDGLAKSCNIVFADLAVELGKNTMTKTANAMGFNKVFHVDDNPTGKSVYDVADATDDELAWSGIGQYTVTTNPTHMMILMGAIANDGVPVNPYLVKKITSSFGIPTHIGSASNGERLLQKSTSDQLKEMMRYNVTSDYGDSMFPGMEVCAKTGTAEVGGDKKPTGWIVGFSSKEETPLAFAVAVEEGNYGRTSAGTIASALMKAAVGQ